MMAHVCKDGINFQKFLNHYHYKALNYLLSTSRSYALSSCVLTVSLIQLVNGATFFNISCLFSLSVVHNAKVASTPITVMVSLTFMHTQICNYIIMQLCNYVLHNL